MKKILMGVIAVVVVAGAFFAGAFAGSEYQKDIFYSVDNETTQQANDVKPAEEEDLLVFTDETLIDILENKFSGGTKYEEKTFKETFSHVSIDSDGRGIAVYDEPAGLGSFWEKWFLTSDGGKTWELKKQAEFPVSEFSIAYLDGVVFRSVSSTDYTTGWVETFINNGAQEGAFVTVEALSGLSDCENTEIVFISEDDEEKTIVIGVCPKTNDKEIDSDDYLFIGKFDKDLNLLKKIKG